jgi:hypothetical protein
MRKNGSLNIISQQGFEKNHACLIHILKESTSNGGRKNNYEQKKRI